MFTRDTTGSLSFSADVGLPVTWARRWILSFSRFEAKALKTFTPRWMAGLFCYIYLQYIDLKKKKARSKQQNNRLTYNAEVSNKNNSRLTYNAEVLKFEPGPVETVWGQSISSLRHPCYKYVVNWRPVVKKVLSTLYESWSLLVP